MNKILIIPIILLITCLSVFAIERNIDWGENYHVSDSQLGLSDFWFNGPYPYHPNNFWFDSCDETTFSNVGEDIRGVDWFTNLGTNTSTATTSLIDNMYIMYNLDGNKSTAEVILQNPTQLQYLDPQPALDTFTLESSVTVQLNGIAQFTERSTSAIQYRNRHLSFLDADDSGTDDIMVLRNVGSDVYLSAYELTSGNLQLINTHNHNVSADLTGTLTSNTTGNVNCFQNVSIGGLSGQRDICVVFDQECHAEIYDVNSTNISNILTLNFEPECNSAVADSNATNYNGVVSNVIVDDFYPTDGSDTSGIAFVYHASNDTDYALISYAQELATVPTFIHNDTMYLYGTNNIYAWDIFKEDTYVHVEELDGSADQWLIFTAVRGSSGDSIVHHYEWNGASRTDNITMNASDVLEGGDLPMMPVFIDESAITGGTQICWEGSCFTGDGIEAFNITGWPSSLDDSDAINLIGGFCDDTVDATGGYSQLLFTQFGTYKIDHNISGITATPYITEIDTTNRNYSGDYGSCMFGYLDSDNKPDLLCFDNTNAEIEYKYSSTSNFPPELTVDSKNWNDSNCYVPSNSTVNSTGIEGTAFTWNFTCSDTENDFVAINIDWNDSSSDTTANFRCNDGLGINTLTHEYNNTGNYTPIFTVNQTATFPSNSDTITSNTLEVSLDAFCVGTTGITSNVTDVSISFDDSQVDGSFKSGFDTFLTTINVTDGPSRLAVALLFMVVFGIGLMFLMLEAGADGQAITVGVGSMEMLLFLFFTYMGLIHIGVFITLIVLVVLGGFFKLRGSFGGGGGD